jgi:hypothetical protein
MLKNAEKTALKSVEVHLLNPPDKRRTINTFSCVSCFALLMEKPKHELVKMILALNDELKYRWPDEDTNPENELTD